MRQQQPLTQPYHPRRPERLEDWLEQQSQEPHVDLRQRKRQLLTRLHHAPLPPRHQRRHRR